MPLLGWNFSREKEAKEILRASEGVEVLGVSETFDVISDRLKLFNGVDFEEKTWVSANKENGWSDYESMPVWNQLSNDCTAHGSMSAVQWKQTIDAYMGFREQQCYIGHRVFAYGAYGAHSGEYGDDGRTISSMLRGLSELGVLPEKTENVPEYSQSLIKSWVKRYTLSQPPYNEYLNAAKKYRVTVGELDNTVDMHWNACFAGLTVCHGSYNLHTLKNGWYVSNGNGGHCRASAGWGTFNGVDYIGMVNSWGDGWGKISKSELTKLVNARYYEAFAIIDMQPMEAAKENYDMIPGQEVFNF